MKVYVKFINCWVVLKVISNTKKIGKISYVVKQTLHFLEYKPGSDSVR